MSAWTINHVERLTALWTQGKTAEQIARLLREGVSGNAVLGKLYRLGLARISAAPVRARSPWDRRARSASRRSHDAPSTA